MKNRNKKLLVSAILLSLFSITFIVSYSFYEFEDKTNELVIQSGIINMTMTDSGALNLTNQYPMEYDDVLVLENDTDTTNDHLINFTLIANNESSDTFYYSLQVVEGEEITGKVRIDPEYISFDLYENISGTDYYYLRNVKLSDYLGINIVANKIEGSSTLNRQFYLRAWINDDLVIGNTSKAKMSLTDFNNSYANISVKIDCDSTEKETPFSYISRATKRNTTTSIYNSTLNKGDILTYNAINSSLAGYNKNYFITVSMNNDEGNSNVTYFFGNYMFYKNKLLNTTTINFKKVSSSFIDNFINNKVKANDLAPDYSETGGTLDSNDTSGTADYFDYTDYNYDGKRTIGYFNQIGTDDSNNPIYEYNIVSDGLIMLPDDCSNMFNLTVQLGATASLTERSFYYNWGTYYETAGTSGSSTSYFQNIEYINFDNVYSGNTTDFGYIFQDLRKLKEIDLSKLDTHNGVRMPGIFCWCQSLTELDLTTFDLSRATDISWIFAGLNLAISEDGLVDDFKGTLQTLDVHRVTTITDIFTNCPNIERLDLRSWYTGTLEFFGSTLEWLNVSDGTPTQGYNTMYACDSDGNIKETYYIGAIMGQKANAYNRIYDTFATLKYLDISNFDVSNLTSMYSMFIYYGNLKTLKLDNWDTSNVTRFDYMFASCRDLVNFDISCLDITSKATTLSHMFYYCTCLTNIDTSSWNTSNVTTMSGLFYNCYALTNLNTSGLDTSKVTTMGCMFDSCKNLTSLDISNFDFSNVTAAGSMFSYCLKLETLNANFNFTTALTSMEYMFSNCNELTSIPSFDNSVLTSVTSLANVFTNCKKITILDLTKVITNSITNLTSTFQGCSSLVTIYVASDFAYESLTDTGTYAKTFYGCTKLVGQNGTTYNDLNSENSYYKTYDRIDTATYDDDGNLNEGTYKGLFSVKSSS